MQPYARAAAKRSEAWLAECAARANGVPMFAAVQGGADEGERRAAAEAAAARDDIAGFSIGSLSAGEAPGATRAGLLAAAIAPLPPHKPRHVTGLGVPLEILTCVEAGVDLLDASFCHVCTQQGLALHFPVGPPPSGGDPGARGAGVGKRKRSADADVGAGVGAGADASAGGGAGAEVEEEDAEERLVAGGDAFKINIWALSYRADPRPLLPGCDCFTCANHSRAYIHHLLQCHEMTAAVLLDIHNIHHYCNFFGAVRGAVGARSFAEFAAFHRTRAAAATS